MVVVLGDSLSSPFYAPSNQSIKTSQVFQCTVSLSRILDCCLPPNLLPIPGNIPTHPSRPSSVITCKRTHAQLPYNPTCQVLSLSGS